MAGDDAHDKPLLAGDGAAAPEITTTTASAASGGRSEASKARLLLISFGAMLLASVANRFASVEVQRPMVNYPLLVNILVTFAYLPASLLWVIPVYLKHGRGALEATPIPQKAWFIMGFLDSVASVLQSLAINKIPNGALVTLLLQSAIPSSMAISRYFLKTSYTRLQYTGAFIVVVGLVVVLGPSFASGGGGDADQVLLWSFILILSCVPMTLSTVYKERSLGDTEIDPIYFNLMVAVYQFIWCFPLLVPSAAAIPLAIGDIGDNLRDGFLCLGGQSPEAGDDNCSASAALMIAYIVANLAYNILIILILKFGSSNILWLSLVASVPIQTASFSIPFPIPGFTVQSFQPTIAAGLPVIFLGLVCYRFHNTLAAQLRQRGWLPFLTNYSGSVDALNTPAVVPLSGGVADSDEEEGKGGPHLASTVAMTPRFAPGTPTVTRFTRPARHNKHGKRGTGAGAAPADEEDLDALKLDGGDGLARI